MAGRGRMFKALAGGGGRPLMKKMLQKAIMGGGQGLAGPKRGARLLKAALGGQGVRPRGLR